MAYILHRHGILPFLYEMSPVLIMIRIWLIHFNVAQAERSWKRIHRACDEQFVLTRVSFYFGKYMVWLTRY
jgi:hypothetical protein